MKIFPQKININKILAVDFQNTDVERPRQPEFNIEESVLNQGVNLSGLFVQDVGRIQKTWGSQVFSAISDLAPNQEFMLPVHAIQPPAIRELRAIELQREGYNIDEIHLPENPWEISEKDLIACSVISNTHSETFTDYGFVLNVPSSCYREANSKDVNSRPPKIGKTWSWQNKPPSVGMYIESGPRALIKDSQGWNQVDLTGTSKCETEKVKPVGIFIKIKNGKLLIDEEDLAKMRVSCIGLPVVLIDKASGQIYKILESLT